LINWLWITDSHLGEASETQVERLLSMIRSCKPAGILISGDIASAQTVRHHLTAIANAASASIYFVLGNHDYYGASIKDVRRMLKEACVADSRLHFLTFSDTVEIGPQLCLIGHDGWADGRCGNYFSSKVSLNDQYYIQDLMGLNSLQRFKVLNSLADDSKEHILSQVKRAAQRYRQILILTHIPPFRGAARYKNVVANDDWAPFFVNQVLGDALAKVALKLPQNQFVVLCGHAHSPSYIKISDNLHVFTGEAKTGDPKIQQANWTNLLKD